MRLFERRRPDMPSVARHNDIRQATSRCHGSETLLLVVCEEETSKLWTEEAKPCRI